MIIIDISSTFFCNLFRTSRQIKIAAWFFIIMQLVGVYPRALITNSGLDSYIGPHSNEWIEKTYVVLILYNLFFLVGIFLSQLILNRKTIKNNQTSVESSLYSDLKKYVGPNGMLLSLIICSLPGVILLLTNHSTLINDSDIANTRAQTQGAGPKIILTEVPFMAVAIWYSFKKGIVKWKWWICTLFLLILSLLSGSRSQTLDFILVLVALRFIQTDLKLKIRTILSLSILGFILVYVGWIIVYARGMMRDFGGSFFMWASSAIKDNPINVFNLLTRKSLNGYDGLVSVVGTVPSYFNFHPGQLWFEMLTILVPRSLWPGKWDVDLVSNFTQIVWGWGAGGNFVTGAGALFIDSGMLGVALGSLLIGILTSFICRARVAENTNHWFAKVAVAVWCFFLARFTFAGGAMDANVAGRMLIEAIFIFIVVKFVTSYIIVVKPQYKIEKH
ncbi:O-antigen polysaccharide polymerase Wzy [Bacillus salipaludis]|uniref:O-antigen polysaccharide polymerase Wzy n=1 Tax=Bacillus salipaludis TaxID=2547811 RepID=A0AA90TA82_9BACI|nr:O-antigen polysaccharide polymerase Wzy [Bacillus salipaludis]MDQ6595002.1 O-antigen polysaccharide polymerase Wzy [Bacillus salipaludis]